MVLKHLSCEKNEVFDKLSQKVNTFFMKLKAPGCNTSTCSTFNPDTQIGRSNIANLTAYTIQQHKCTAEDSVTTALKQRGFEVIKMVIFALTVWKVIASLVRALHGPDLLRGTDKAFHILEGLLTLLIALSLFKFDTTVKTMEELKLKHFFAVLVASIVLGGVYLSSTRRDDAVVVIAVTCALLVVTLVGVYLTRHTMNTSVKTIVNDSINTFNKATKATSFKVPIIDEWRMRVPTFTDTVFISVASYLLLGDAFTKLSHP